MVNLWSFVLSLVSTDCLSNRTDLLYCLETKHIEVVLIIVPLAILPGILSHTSSTSVLMIKILVEMHFIIVIVMYVVALFMCVVVRHAFIVVTSWIKAALYPFMGAVILAHANTMDRAGIFWIWHSLVATAASAVDVALAWILITSPTMIWPGLTTVVFM